MWGFTLGIRKSVEQLFMCTRSKAIQKLGLLTIQTSEQLLSYL